MTRALDPAIAAEVAGRVDALRARIASAAVRAGRDASDVTLVGAAKRQPVEVVAAAVAAGVRELGHNYVQEARDARDALESRLAELHPGAAPPSLRWRMIGHLQRNKAGAAAGLFDCVDTLDSARLARALDRRAGEAGRHIELCVQVNLSGESQKSGLAEADLPALLEACADLEHVAVVGLMTMPAATDDPEAARPVFARLRTLRDALRERPGGHRLAHLSMGMSRDFEIAIEEGATLVRVGSALFGERATP